MFNRPPVRRAHVRVAEVMPRVGLGLAPQSEKTPRLDCVTPQPEIKRGCLMADKDARVLQDRFLEFPS